MVFNQREATDKKQVTECTSRYEKTLGDDAYVLSAPSCTIPAIYPRSNQRSALLLHRYPSMAQEIGPLPLPLVAVFLMYTQTIR